MLFAEDAVLILGERSSDDEEEEVFDEDTLIQLDAYTLEELERVDAEGHYRGARVSPGRRWIALYDTRVDPARLQLLDSRTLTFTSFTHEPHVARWMNTTDELLTVRLLVPLVEILPVDGEPGSVIWPEARLSIELVGHIWEDGPDSRMPGVSPDDTTLVIPTVDGPLADRMLAVIDVATEGVRYIHDAWGPVDFTADGGTFYAYRQAYDEEALAMRAQLLVVDVASLEVEQHALPFEEASTFFVSETGIYVGIVGIEGDPSSWFTPTRIAIFDLNRRIVTEIEDDVGWTSEKVLHPGHDELYMVQVDGLSRLDMLDAAIEPVGLYVHPLHVALMPSRSRIMLDDASSARYSLWNLDPFGDAGWVVLP
jgi:hypothetical protein